MDPERTRRRLLDAALAHVPFDGWTNAAIKAAAADLGLDQAAARNAVPGGPAELVEAFYAEIDRRMLARLEAMDLPAMRMRDRVAAAVCVRLELLAPHREAVRRSLSFLALPPNAPLATACLYRTVDAIWHAVGDTATDFSFYTKRLLLSAVYSTTLLFWLNDTSDDFADTRAFLERRIDGALKTGGSFGRLAETLLDLPDRVFARRRGAGVRRTATGPDRFRRDPG